MDVAKSRLSLIGKHGPMAVQLLKLVWKISGILFEKLPPTVKMKIIVEMICQVLGGFLGGLCGCTLLAKLIITDTGKRFIRCLPGSILKEVVLKVLEDLFKLIGFLLGGFLFPFFYRKIINAFQRLREYLQRRQKPARLT